jgi:4-cresol dehydrogenase (hydroxylating)
LCGLDVVLPDGRLLHTGGPLQQNRSRYVHRFGIGPYLDGLFSQSNFGVVVRTGVWLTPKPKNFELCIMETSEDKIPNLIDALRELSLHGSIHSNFHIANDIAMLSILKKYPYDMLKPGEKSLSAVALQQLRRRYRMAQWSVSLGIYGSSREIAAYKKEIKSHVAGLARTEFVDRRKYALVRWLLRNLSTPILGSILSFGHRKIAGREREMIELIPGSYDLHLGRPDSRFAHLAYFKAPGSLPANGQLDPARDNAGSVWHAPVVPATGKDTACILGIARKLYRKWDIDFYCCFARMNPRAQFCLMGMLFNPENSDEVNRIRGLQHDLSEEINKAGYQSYRTGLSSFPSMRDQNQNLADILSDIKAAVDPHGVFAPGRYGIYPKKRTGNCHE